MSPRKINKGKIKFMTVLAQNKTKTVFKRKRRKGRTFGKP
jgi:hypothetical protein